MITYANIFNNFMNSSTIPQCRDDKDESVACVHVDKSAILERLKTVSST